MWYYVIWVFTGGGQVCVWEDYGELLCPWSCMHPFGVKMALRNPLLLLWATSLIHYEHFSDLLTSISFKCYAKPFTCFSNILEKCLVPVQLCWYSLSEHIKMSQEHMNNHKSSEMSPEEDASWEMEAVASHLTLGSSPCQPSKWKPLRHLTVKPSQPHAHYTSNLVK